MCIITARKKPHADTDFRITYTSVVFETDRFYIRSATRSYHVALKYTNVITHMYLLCLPRRRDDNNDDNQYRPTSRNAQVKKNVSMY